MPQISLYEVTFIAIISGTLIYTIWSTITYILSTNRKVKKLSFNSLFAGLLYLISIIILYLFKSDILLSFVIASMVYVLKFLLEKRMLANLEYGEIKCSMFCNILFGIIVTEVILKILNITEVNFYLLSIIIINLLIAIQWFLKKSARILGAMNIISIIFLILINDKSLALLFSLIPYGFNTIFLNSKDYINTVSSLFIINQYGETILEEQIEEYKDFIYLLINKIESRYSLRNMHSINVKAISEGIALEMKLDTKTISYISDASMIHDIGYLGIDHREISENPSEDIPEKLKHVLIGKYILESSDIFIKYIPVVLYHHENLDGSGPEKLKNKYIPLAAKIVRVADVFERLINGRNGKRYTIKEALNYIKSNKVRLFDPVVVDALERYVNKHY